MGYIGAPSPWPLIKLILEMVGLSLALGIPLGLWINRRWAMDGKFWKGCALGVAITFVACLAGDHWQPPRPAQPSQQAAAPTSVHMAKQVDCGPGWWEISPEGQCVAIPTAPPDPAIPSAMRQEQVYTNVGTASASGGTTCKDAQGYWHGAADCPLPDPWDHKPPTPVYWQSCGQCKNNPPCDEPKQIGWLYNGKVMQPCPVDEGALPASKPQ